MDEEKNLLKFKYDGDSNSIAINTLLSSQFHWAAILTEFHKNLHPGLDLNIKIEALNRGSFEVSQLFEVVIPAGSFMLTYKDAMIETLSAISDYFSILAFLKGKKADKIETSGPTINIYLQGDNIKVAQDAFKIYQNNLIVNNAIKEMGTSLENDDDITGISVSDEKLGDIVSVPKKHFPMLTAPNPYLTSDDTKERVVEAYLGIQKWETAPKKGTKWSFVYKGRVINQVVIKDEVFLTNINKEKLRFGAGDRLQAELLIVSKLDPATEMFIDEKYEVLSVRQIIYREQAREFDFPDED